MTAPPFRRRGIVQQRREDITRIEKMTVKVTRVTGYVLIVHAETARVAEASVDIGFPVVFTEKPVFTFGSELAENHSPSARSYPQLSATVASWETAGAADGVTEGRFVGATVVAVSRGQKGQNIWLHYSFEGRAIRNPLNKLGDLDGAL